MSIRQDIGPVSAYALAKEKGYQGTEEEFEQAMANVGTNIGEIKEAIDTFNDVTVPTATQSITNEGSTQVGLVNAAGTAQVEAVEEKGTIEIGAVEAAGTAQISAVNSAGSTQVGNVNTAGSTQVNAVNGAGTTQVGNVNTAGGTQVAAVQAKGDEVIASIPEDYSELTQEVSDLNQAIILVNKNRNNVILYKNNYFNKATVVNNNYYTGSVGNEVQLASNGDYWCAKVPVVPGQSYRIARRDFDLYELDENDIILPRHTTGNTDVDFIYTVQSSQAKYIAISVYRYANPRYTPDTFIITDSFDDLEPYVNYPNEVEYNDTYLKDNGVAFETDVNNEINKVGHIIYNYFNEEDSILQHYYNGSVGNVVVAVSNANYWCGLVEVTKGKTYLFPRLDYDLYELDEDMKILARESHSNYNHDVEYTPTSNGVKYLAFSLYRYSGTSGLPIYTPDTYMVLDPNTSTSDYIPYPYIVEYDSQGLVFSGAMVEKVYYVSPGNFIDTLKSLAGDSTPKIIYVMPGVYDIYDEMGGSDFLHTIDSSSRWRDVNVFVPDNTKIIGLGDVTFNYLPEASDFTNANQVSCISPLNTIWNCEIENLKIYGKNCRYCIHDEAGGFGDGIPKRKKYKNLIVEKLPNTYHPSESYISGQAYGSGMITGYAYEYENCYFKSQENYCWTCHTGEGDYTYTGNLITIKNCVFESPSWSGIRFGSTQGTPTGIQKYCKVSILDSYIQNKILLTREADTAPAPNQYDLTLMNCNEVTIRDRFAEEGWTNIYTPKIYNPIPQSSGN